jgi:hypothetical protein
MPLLGRALLRSKLKVVTNGLEMPALSPPFWPFWMPVFAVMSRFLLDQCLHASLQRLAHMSLDSAVPMAALHKHDIATKGNLFEAISRSGWRGPLYRCGFPVVVMVVSATLKKAFTIESRLLETNVTRNAASLVDPVNTDSPCQGRRLSWCHCV